MPNCLRYLYVVLLSYPALETLIPFGVCSAILCGTNLPVFESVCPLSYKFFPSVNNPLVPFEFFVYKGLNVSSNDFNPLLSCGFNL